MNTITIEYYNEYELKKLVRKLRAKKVEYMLIDKWTIAIYFIYDYSSNRRGVYFAAEAKATNTAYFDINQNDIATIRLS